ncbi:kelch-like protein 26 isoform X2 [Phthorimaea operculella]|nr:kelch-like protein 26 isoform X2 [Phthorimaea operculella]
MEGKVKILVKGQRFEVNLESLCERSDYFLMNYLYSGEEEITLDLIDVASMELIVKYVESGINVNDLSDYTLPTIGKFAEAANLLEFTELSEIIETYLTLREIMTENWIELIKFAEHYNYVKLKQLCIEFGVPPLKDMELQWVTKMDDLFWYLSQTQLFASKELEVFQFSLDWMIQYNVDVDPPALLMILGCLDIKRVTRQDLLEIQTACSQFGAVFNNSLAAQVVNCLLELSECHSINTERIVEKESIINEKYSVEVYHEVLSLVESSRSRSIEYIPVVSMIKPEISYQKYGRIFRDIIDFREPTASTSSEQLRPILLPTKRRLSGHFDFSGEFTDAGYTMHKFTGRGLEKWLDVKIPKWKLDHRYNWNVAAWGPRRLVLVLSKSKLQFATGGVEFSAIDSFAVVKVYNVLKKEWTEFNPVLPNVLVRRLAVVRDSLFIIGFEINVIFDLKNSTYKNIAQLPYSKRDVTRVETRIPLICVHNDQVFVSDLSSIHKYDDTSDEWVKVIDRHISNMVSNDDGYVYVTDVVSNTVCRFRPDIDAKMDVVGKFNDDFNPMVNVCALGDQLVSFTNRDQDTLSIQTFSTKMETSSEVMEVWCEDHSDLRFDPYRSTCRLLLEEPAVDFDFTEYHKKLIINRDKRE